MTDGVHLYCALRPGVTPGPAVSERAGRPVSGTMIGGVDLWLGESGAPPPTTLEEIRRHHDVVKTAWEVAEACLPLRFGQWFEDRDELRRAMDKRAEELRTGLDRVRGAAEMSVRCLARGGRNEAGTAAAPARTEARNGPADGAGPGRAYLEALRRKADDRTMREDREESLAGELHELLGSHVRQERRIPLERVEELMHIVVLFDRGREAQIRDAVGRLADRHPDLVATVTGPWPPWTFGS